ncbi:MAG: YHYH protein [Flavobacteriales bacterium]|jgi:hypothetical protein|tara:strand:+ start:2992 stop:3747 length:756 start_codon:yes stop_codon:yes gene_type:complete
MKKHPHVLALFLLFLTSCGISDPDPIMIDEVTEGNDVPEIYQKIYSASDMYLEDGFVVIQVNGVPDHNSPYFDASDDRNVAYSGTNENFNLNPNRIDLNANYTYKIPLNPTAASNPRPTQLGSIGVALNGVSFYNQYAGPNNQPLTDEIDSFDQYNGHPQRVGEYHYHVEPTYLTQSQGNNVLLGFLLDGFPVYGPFENGERVVNSILDEYHGHEHVTADYPEGIYHYHITDADPYINGSGYYGTAGTVTR